VSNVAGVQRGDDAWSISMDDFNLLRRSKFDVAICTNSVTYYPDLLLATALGIPNRVSFVHKGMSGLVTHPVAIEFPSAYPAYFRALVASVTGMQPTWSLRPQVFPDERSTAEGSRVFGEIDEGQPVVACVLTSRQKHGQWPSSFLVQILSEARKLARFSVAFCGAADEEEQIEKLAASYPHEKSIIAGKLDILGFAAFLARCNALLTLDSGPRHIANAVGTRVLFTRNMSSSQVETGAYCDSEIDVSTAGEYLTPDEILRVSAQTSPVQAANSLVAVLSPELQAKSLQST
jgi:ADP-heptose:LPS heptosyltransferase